MSMQSVVVNAVCAVWKNVSNSSIRMLSKYEMKSFFWFFHESYMDSPLFFFCSVQCAIFGTPFCESGRKAFFLILRNASSVGALGLVSGGVLWIGKLLVSTLTTTVWVPKSAFGLLLLARHSPAQSIHHFSSVLISIWKCLLCHDTKFASIVAFVCCTLLDNIHFVICSSGHVLVGIRIIDLDGIALLHCRYRNVWWTCPLRRW